MNRVYIQSNRLPKQELIKEKDPVHFRSLMLIFLTCSLVVLGILSYIWRGVEILTMGYKMRDVYTQQRVLKDQGQRLALERAALRSMSRIESIATSQLRMVKPDPDQVVILTRKSSKHDTQQDSE
jgi:cell division protein FtsL